MSEKRDGEAYLGFMVFTIALCVLCAIHAKQVFANSIVFRSSRADRLQVFAPVGERSACFIADLQHRVEEASSIEKKIIRAVLSTLREEGMLELASSTRCCRSAMKARASLADGREHLKTISPLLLRNTIELANTCFA